MKPRPGVAYPAAVGAVLVAGFVSWGVLRHPAASFVGRPTENVPMANEEALLASPAQELSLFRFAAAPRIVVAVFPSLHAQAMALNRVAAFIERPGVPHDHVLNDTALLAAIGHSTMAFDTYYYGHDYRAADLARFYATAASDGVALNADEIRLRVRLAAVGLLQAKGPAALISLPPRGLGLLDPAARVTIMHHELSHGAYFTDPVYAAYVASFWRDLTGAERAAFRQFLGSEGYDAANEDLMRNEAQAYLVFTADPRMFDVSRLGLPEAPMLRDAFMQRLPLAWLRRDTAAQ